jgi:antitoxin component of MazEF toxin-antitoxin module
VPSSLRCNAGVLPALRKCVEWQQEMIRTLTKTGNSMALRLTKEMREHLGVTDKVDVQYIEGAIVLRRPPMRFEEAKMAALDKMDVVLGRKS